MKQMDGLKRVFRLVQTSFKLVPVFGDSLSVDLFCGAKTVELNLKVI